MVKRGTFETGDIFFLYTPRSSTAQGPSDVHEVAFILSPDRGHPRRLFVLRAKSFPLPASPGAPGGQEAVADLVEVQKAPERLVEALEDRAEHTIGVPEGSLHVRPCGEGRYALAFHDEHTHLSYALELPDRPGPVQRDLNIFGDATYRVSVRVPAAVARPGLAIRAGESVPLTDVGLLDKKGSELVLQPGVEPDAPTAAREPEGPATAEIFGELKLTRDWHPTEPLYDGIWK